jgi:hypothetical protein
MKMKPPIMQMVLAIGLTVYLIYADRDYWLAKDITYFSGLTSGVMICAINGVTIHSLLEYFDREKKP